MKNTTIGQERNGSCFYHDGQCFNCGRQFMSDYDRLILVGDAALDGVRVKFCTATKCVTAAHTAHAEMVTKRR